MMNAAGNFIKRDAARRIHIKTILESCLDSSSEQSVLKLNNGVSCSRIRLLGVVVNKRFKNTRLGNPHLDSEFNSESWSSSFYTSIDLDDSTGVINIRAWDDQAIHLNKYNIGEIVEIIGKPREYNGRIYILYECGFKIDDIHWWLLHELKILLEGLNELEDNKGVLSSGNVNKHIIKRFSGNNLDGGMDSLKLMEESLADKILDIVCRLDTGEGVLFTNIKNELEEFKTDEIEDVLKQLLREGTLYECKPHRYRKSY